MEKVNRKPRLGPAKGVNITQEQYRKAAMRRNESSKRFIDAQRRILLL